jgi:hypothetical protein
MVGSSQDFTNSNIVKIGMGGKHERNQEGKVKSTERPKTAIDRNP